MHKVALCAIGVHRHHHVSCQHDTAAITTEVATSSTTRKNSNSFLDRLSGGMLSNHQAAPDSTISFHCPRMLAMPPVRLVETTHGSRWNTHH